MKKVIIIGGGIGGLCTAIALRRRGIPAQVYEAASELKAVGAGIWVPTNAMQALDRLGIADEVAAAGVPLLHAEVRDSRAGRLTRTSFGWTKERFGHPTIAIHRGRLQQVLLEQLPADAVTLARVAKRIVQEGNRVRITFESGREEEADVVIGADGLHSVVRRSIFSDARLRYAGQTSYRGISRMELPEAWRHGGAEIWGSGCRFGFSHIGPDEVYWFAAEDAREGEKADPQETLEHLKALADSFPAPIRSLLERTNTSGVIRTDLYDLKPLPAWSKGRVVLLGDAAHATTPNLGQGGAQAIEDAYVLADALTRSDTPEQAFQEYERIRTPKARRIVTTSYWMGKMAHVRNPVLRAVRNTMIRHTPDSVNRKQLESLFTLDY